MSYKIVHAQDYITQTAKPTLVENDYDINAMNGWKRRITAGSRVCIGNSYQQIIYNNNKYEVFVPDFHLHYDDGFLEMWWYSLKGKPSISWMDHEDESLRQVNISDVSQHDSQSLFTSLFNVLTHDLFNPIGLDINKIKSDYFDFMEEKQPQLPNCFYITVKEKVHFSHDDKDYSLLPGDYEAKIKSWSPNSGIVCKIRLTCLNDSSESFISQRVLEELEGLRKIVRIDESSDNNELSSNDGFYSDKSNYIEWNVGKWFSELPSNIKPDLSEKYREKHDNAFNVGRSLDAFTIIRYFLMLFVKVNRNVDVSSINHDATKFIIRRHLYDMSDREISLLKMCDTLNINGNISDEAYQNLKICLVYDNGGAAFLHTSELGKYGGQAKEELASYLRQCNLKKGDAIAQAVSAIKNDINSNSLDDQTKLYMETEFNNALED